MGIALTEFEEVERPAIATVGRPRSGLTEAIRRTADTGKAIRVPWPSTKRTLPFDHGYLKGQGYAAHYKRDGEAVIVWAERLNGHAPTTEPTP